MKTVSMEAAVSGHAGFSSFKNRQVFWSIPYYGWTVKCASQLQPLTPASPTATGSLITPPFPHTSCPSRHLPAFRHHISGKSTHSTNWNTQQPPLKASKTLILSAIYTELHRVDPDSQRAWSFAIAALLVTMWNGLQRDERFLSYKVRIL